jgi:AAHS family 4-hydroxybenzoate transporter-like MFS transporter
MADGSVVQVSHLLDERGFSGFHVKLLVWSLFIVFIDGYDINAIAVAAPELIKAWHFPPRELGLVLSASNIGVILGSLLFGFVGDRYGRKPALIGANILFGIFTVMAAYSTSLTEMTWLRVLAGIGIGGVIPNVIALNAESAPRRLRATLAIMAAGLVPIGGGLPGIVELTLVPQYGWPIIFLIGGIAPIAFALVAIFGLPESIKYMTLHPRYRGAMEKLVHSIRPGFRIPPDARYVIEDEKNYTGFSPKYLFGDGLKLITPLLWVIFALNLMGFFFLASWTPTLLVTAAHLPPTTAGIVLTSLQFGGTAGAFGLCLWIGRRRFQAISVLFVLAVPVVASIGWFGVTSLTAVILAAFVGGFLVLGIQSGINVVGAMIYPTSLRANGSGWQLGIGRFGAIAGPYLGAFFVGMPVEQLYMWAAIPFALGAVVCFAVYRLNETRQKAMPAIGQAAAAE